jgi:hypothetical protein
MARLAERHQVLKVVCAAVVQRPDVMDLCRGGEFAEPLAALAERVGGQVLGAYLPPLAPVALVDGWVTLVMVVVRGLFLGVLLAEPAVGQPRAARV